MDWSMALTVAGTVATVLFGAFGIYLAVRQKYAGRIELLNDFCIPLFESIGKTFPELTILHDGSPLNDRLVLLKAFILNSGNKDISPEMVADKLSLSLPKDYKWRAAKITAHSPRVQASVVVTDSALTFDMGLLRCNEYIAFQALADLPQDASAKDLPKKLEAGHRIADTQSVKLRDLPPKSKRTRRIARVIPLAVMAIIFPAMAAYELFINDRSNLLELRYMLRDGDKSVEARVKPGSPGLLVAEMLNGQKNVTFGIQEFNQRVELPPLVREKDPWLTYVFALNGLFPLLFVAFELVELRRTRRLLRILSIES